MTTVALSIHDVSVVVGGRAVVRDVSLVVNVGEAVTVIGRSGAGKSVLWKAVAGLMPRATGDVRVVQGPLLFVHQDPALLDDRSVYENLRLGLQGSSLPSRIATVSARLAIRPLLDVPAYRLSPAQARRVALARALVRDPGVLVVDEPTTGLDVNAAADVDAALVDAAGSGTTLIVITHHPRTWAALRQRAAARTIVIDDGQAHELPPHFQDVPDVHEATL